MKEATGEVSMTMVTIIAIGVISAILIALWPNIKNWINDEFNTVRGPQAYQITEKEDHNI